MKSIYIIHAYGSILSTRRGHYRMAPLQEYAYWTTSVLSEKNRMGLMCDKINATQLLKGIIEPGKPVIPAAAAAVTASHAMPVSAAIFKL